MTSRTASAWSRMSRHVISSNRSDATAPVCTAGACSPSHRPARLARSRSFVIAFGFAMAASSQARADHGRVDPERFDHHAPVHGPALDDHLVEGRHRAPGGRDRKSTRLNSSHITISYAVFCL